MVVGVGLILASTAYPASVHAQANSTSSAAATNMTSAGAHKSTMGAAGNITIVLVRETVMPLTVKPAQIKTYAEVGKIQ